MKKISFIILTAFFMLALVPVSQARHHKGGNHVERLTRQLDLTPEQVTEVKTIHKNFHKKIKSKRKAVKTAKRSLAKAFKSNASQDTIKSKFANYNALQSQYNQLKFDRYLKIRNLITPKQRKMLKAYGKRHHKKCDKKQCDRRKSSCEKKCCRKSTKQSCDWRGKKR